MEQNVQRYLQAALAKSTLSSYKTAHRRYVNFCLRSTHTPYPTTATILTQFVAFLGTQNLKHQTIKSYLSGIRYYHIIQSHPDPFTSDMPRLTYVLKGIKSSQSKDPTTKSKTRLPITPKILHELQHALHIPSFDNIMLWAAALTCFYGFLRSGEITIPSASSFDASAHLCLSDISVDNAQQPSIIRLHLKASKTDLHSDKELTCTWGALATLFAL